MHLSYSDYIAAGGIPGLTNWVKYNWLGDTSMIAAKSKYLVIDDLQTFHTASEPAVWQIKTIKKTGTIVYGKT